MNSVSTAVIPNRRGRPRSEAAKAAILGAADAILREQGLREMSIDAVAHRAGVSKATIYRWWRSKADLALDTFLQDVGTRVPLVDTGSLAGDMRARAQATARAYSSQELGPVLAALIGEAQADPDFAIAFRDRVVRPLREGSLEIFKRAMARGEIAEDTAIEVVLDMLMAPIYYRLLLRTGRIDTHFADRLVDILLAALSPRKVDSGGGGTGETA
jgi:AcrR family transcriptional regulator